MDQELLINLTPNIIQDFIDLKTATKKELNYLKENLKSFFTDYLDPKLKYKNIYIDSQAIRIKNNIHKEIVNLEKRIEKLNIIIEGKILTKKSEFYKFYCDLLDTYGNIKLWDFKILNTVIIPSPPILIGIRVIDRNMITENLWNKYKIKKDKFGIIIGKLIIKKEVLKIILIKLKDIPLNIRIDIIEKVKISIIRDLMIWETILEIIDQEEITAIIENNISNYGN